MSPENKAEPENRAVIALDGVTHVMATRNDIGNVLITLTAGAVIMRALILGSDFAFLASAVSDTEGRA